MDNTNTKQEIRQVITESKSLQSVQDRLYEVSSGYEDDGPFERNTEYYVVFIDHLVKSAHKDKKWDKSWDEKLPEEIRQPIKNLYNQMLESGDDDDIIEA